MTPTNIAMQVLYITLYITPVCATNVNAYTVMLIFTWRKEHCYANFKSSFAPMAEADKTKTCIASPDAMAPRILDKRADTLITKVLVLM
jgi:hypothetical protein